MNSESAQRLWRLKASNYSRRNWESESRKSPKFGPTILPREGIEREALIRVRVNQSFFRRRILSAYEFRCSVTGLSVPELLVASHIVPWSQDWRTD